MARIGIITGSGPQAGIDLWQKILRFNEEQISESTSYNGDKDAPHVVIHSVPQIAGPHFEPDLRPGAPKHEPLMKALQETIIRISRDCDVFCIACHTLHYLEKPIRAWMRQAEIDGNSLAHFMSIVSTTKDAIEDSGASKVAIAGSKVSSDVEGSSPYRSIIQLKGVVCKASSDACRARQQDAIIACKKYGPDDADAISLMSDVFEELSDHDVVVLACTEFPLIASRIKPSNAPWLLDPTEVLARRLLTFKGTTTSAGG